MPEVKAAVSGLNVRKGREQKKMITTRASQEEEQEDMPSCCLLPGDAKNRRTSRINIQQIHE